MTIALYNFPQSTCSQKVRLMLWEKGIEYEDRIVDHKTREHLKEPYLKLNPNGVVPTMVHDDAIIIDSSVIMEYLDEVFPETPLTPADPVKRAHMRKWMRYLEEVPTPAIRVPSFNKYLAKRYAGLTNEQFAEMAENHPIRKQFYQHMQKEAGFSKEETEDALDRLQQGVDRFEKGLADSGGPWIMGEMLTIADYCYTPTVDRMNDLELAYMWDDRPLVAAWYGRIQARPAFAKTYYPGTRLTEIFGREAA